LHFLTLLVSERQLSFAKLLVSPEKKFVLKGDVVTAAEGRTAKVNIKEQSRVEIGQVQGGFELEERPGKVFS
jgi:hypothetical protein